MLRFFAGGVRGDLRLELELKTSVYGLVDGELSPETLFPPSKDTTDALPLTRLTSDCRLGSRVCECDDDAGDGEMSIQDWEGCRPILFRLTSRALWMDRQ